MFPSVTNARYTGFRRFLVCLGFCAIGGSVSTGTASADQALVRAVAESNVNHQYVIESVSISGIEVARFHDVKLSPSLRQRLASLVGAPCDMTAIGDLAGRLRSALRLEDVHERLLRGSSPDRVRVDFQVVRKDYGFDLSVPRFLYDSNQGWTTEVNASGRYRQQSVSIGLGSNGDDLIERFTGFSTRYENLHVFSDHVRFALGIEGYNDIWNPLTRRAVADQNVSAPGTSAFALYRNRRNVAPTLTFVLSRELSVSVGASFEGMDMENPQIAGREVPQSDLSANAATAAVDFGYSIEDAGVQQRWDARYGLRFATHDLGSNYVYYRQDISLRYEWKTGRHVIADRLMGGVLVGQAPLFERFVLGNSSTLLGWNRYAIDALGGDRMVHNSLSYGYQVQKGTAEVFYNAGLLGDGEKLGTVRYSLGLGFRQGIFNVAMAFPVIEGRIAPVFFAGMNY
jgi:hypothetical protein